MLRPVAVLSAIVLCVLQAGCGVIDVEKDEATQSLITEFEHEIDQLRWSDKPRYRQVYSPLNFYIVADVNLGHVSQGRFRQVRDTLVSQRQRAIKRNVNMEWEIEAVINGTRVSADESIPTDVVHAMLPLTGLGTRELNLTFPATVHLCAPEDPLCGPRAQYRLVEAADDIQKAITASTETSSQFHGFTLIFDNYTADNQTDQNGELSAVDIRNRQVELKFTEDSALDSEGVEEILQLLMEMDTAAAPVRIETLEYVVGNGVSFVLAVGPGSEWTPQVESSITQLVAVIRAAGIAEPSNDSASLNRHGFGFRLNEKTVLYTAELIGCSDTNEPAKDATEQQLRALVEAC